MVICLEQGADLHMAQLMPLLLTVSCFSKIMIGLPFWYWLTQVVLEKRPLRGVCMCDEAYCQCCYGALTLQLGRWQCFLEHTTTGAAVNTIV